MGQHPLHRPDRRRRHGVRPHFADSDVLSSKGEAGRGHTISNPVDPCPLGNRSARVRTTPDTIGHPYSATMSASGGHAPYIWKIVPGSKSKEIKLDEQTGIFSGAPTRSTTSTFTVEVRGTRVPGLARNNAEATFTISVS
ncbi:MAG: Ig domain-containing protein [Acidimicrobiales bacterium]